MFRLALLFLLCCCAVGCGLRDPITKTTVATADGQHTHAIFMDGTRNDFASETNVTKLRSQLVYNEVNLEPNSLGTFYIDGVGARFKVMGMATGWGFRHRVKTAYQYLIQHHRNGDNIYLFGFSRGAYSARVLAALLRYGGLPDEPIKDKEKAKRIARVLYEAYKGDMVHQQRVAAMSEAKDKLAIAGVFERRSVKFMGLWDTVESMAMIDWKEDPVGENENHFDQLCNVQKAVHAVSLDDNRATNFTPVLLARPERFEACQETALGEPWVRNDDRMRDDRVRERLNATVDEVWFFGAHADVGGGYEDHRVNAISLNWMFDHLVAQGLLPLGYERHIEGLNDEIHDAEKRMPIYLRNWRDLASYVHPSYNDGKLKVHSTVFQRLRADSSPGHLPPGLFHDDQEFKENCFSKEIGKFVLFDPIPAACLLTVAGPPK